MSSSASPNSTNMSFVGTPSKHKLAQAFFGRTNSKLSPQAISPSTSSSQTTSFGKVSRYILLGFGIGAAFMALVQSVNMPTIRVELEYEDAPVEVQQRRHKQAFIIGSKQQQQRAAKQLITGGDNNDADNNLPEDPEADNTVPISDVDATEKTTKKHHNNKKGKSAKKQKKDSGINLIEQEMEHEEDDPDFSNPGPVPKLDPDEAFAACILIKDDNHWLIEWLAYHYHTMPLRYLIVAVDPDSKTSPIPILKRYKDKNLMTISIWNDKMFMPKKIKANAKMFNNNTGLMEHRVRQNNFYFKCMRTFKQRNREWLMLIDTDEYIVTNYASGLYYNITKNIPISKPGNVLKFIKQHHQLTGENHTCSYMPRYMFGIKESDKAMVQKHMPKGLDGRNLLTQRFLYRNPRRMHNGKNLINIRKLPQIKTYTSVHHVSSYCPDPDQMRKVNHVKKALVRVHHYLGTPEQYFFRSDPRMAQNKSASANGTDSLGLTKTSKNKTKTTAYFTRGKGRFEMLNKGAVYPDQGARAWITGFIKDVGIDTAKELLAGVGQVDYSPIIATDEEEHYENPPNKKPRKSKKLEVDKNEGKKPKAGKNGEPKEEPKEDPNEVELDASSKEDGKEEPEDGVEELEEPPNEENEGANNEAPNEGKPDDSSNKDGEEEPADLPEEDNNGEPDDSSNKDGQEEPADLGEEDHENAKEDPNEGKSNDSSKKDGEEGKDPGDAPKEDAEEPAETQ